MEAEAILRDAVSAYRAALGERLVAAYALGSLAHGGFAPLVSDIDLGLIVADPLHPDDAETVQSVADAAKNASGSTLAERLSVFWGTPATLRGQREGGRFPPLDRLDLIDNGRLLEGVDDRHGLPRPDTGELLISGAQFALEFLAGEPTAPAPANAGLGSLEAANADAIEELSDPELLLARGIRRVTKLVLFPVRFMFTAATGRVATNQEASAWYLALEDNPGADLVAAAVRWRDVPPIDHAIAATLLRAHLLPLYERYVDDHIGRLSAAGCPALVRGFERWSQRLARELELALAADRIVDAFASRRLLAPLSESNDWLDEDAAYEIARRVQARRQARGETPVGRKVGFTNRTIWPQFGVWSPIWGAVYDSTVRYARDGHARVPVGNLLQPFIEPEIQLHFARTPPVTRDEALILDCVDWISQGFELVQCPYPDWKFRAADTIAAYALHGTLVIGPPVPVTGIEACAAKLRAFTITVFRNGVPAASGGGAHVLDSPLLAFAHLAEVLARQPRAAPVQAGEVVTTGTLTPPLPVSPGDEFSAVPEGIELPQVTLAIG
jgi:2-keto-4-pentenoate hydratase